MVTRTAYFDGLALGADLAEPLAEGEGFTVSPVSCEIHSLRSWWMSN
jgi:hypothetical protein